MAEGPKPKIRERKHRFDRAAYRGKKSVAFTGCIRDRTPALADPEIVAAFVPLLTEAAEKFYCIVPIYAFMPDHLHVLLIGTSEQSDMKSAMDAFKFSTGWWFYRHQRDLRWQKGYWDHVVRDFEGWTSQAKYIAANPCRAGLCSHVLAWPYTGSIHYDLNEIVQEAFW